MEYIKLQDGNSHWYWVPSQLERSFKRGVEELSGLDYMDNPDLFDKFTDKYQQYATGGSPDVVPEYYREKFKKLIDDAKYISTSSDKIFEGLKILSKYTSYLVQGAGHDLVYGPNIDKLINNNISEIDIVMLGHLGWFVEDNTYLAHYC